MTQQFTGKAAAYTQGRPAYPEALFDDLYANYGFAAGQTIADMGCGTGKFCAPLLTQGSAVIGVEPNMDMLSKAVHALGHNAAFTPLETRAEDTGIRPACIDHITCAAAFHWLDARAFQAECRRILKPHGKVVLVWNVRDADAPFNRAYIELLRAYCPTFTSLSHGYDACQNDLRRFYGGQFDKLSYADDALLTREQFVSRSLSSSYALKPEDARYAAFVEALGALFDAWQQERVVVVPAQTVVFIGEPSPSFE